MAIKILLIENESSEADDITRILESLYYEVSHASSDEDAYEIALNIMPDLILIDTQLNRNENISVTPKIKELDIPTVHLTSYPMKLILKALIPMNM
jgi:CheY-like chemotaxis protein